MSLKHFVRRWLSLSIAFPLLLVSYFRRNGVSLLEIPGAAVWMLAFTMAAVECCFMWTFWKGEGVFLTVPSELLFVCLTAVSPSALDSRLMMPVWFLLGVQVVEVLFLMTVYFMRKRDETIGRQLECSFAALFACIAARVNYPL